MSWFDGDGNDSGGETAPALVDNLSVETDNFSVEGLSNVGEDILSGGIGGRGESWDGVGLAFLDASTGDFLDGSTGDFLDTSTGDFLDGSTLNGFVGLIGSTAVSGEDSFELFGTG